jgi:hypothetical protein
LVVGSPTRWHYPRRGSVAQLGSEERGHAAGQTYLQTSLLTHSYLHTHPGHLLCAGVDCQGEPLDRNQGGLDIEDVQIMPGTNLLVMSDEYAPSIVIVQGFGARCGEVRSAPAAQCQLDAVPAELEAVPTAARGWGAGSSSAAACGVARARIQCSQSPAAAQHSGGSGNEALGDVWPDSWGLEETCAPALQILARYVPEDSPLSASRTGYPVFKVLPALFSNRRTNRSAAPCSSSTPGAHRPR